MDALKQTIEAAKKHGKFVIFGAKFPYWESAQNLIDLGVQAIEIGHDVSILSTVWKKTIQAVRK